MTAVSPSVPPYVPLDDLPEYRAGRSAAAVAAEHGLAAAIKLASNESPFGPLPSVVEAMAAATAVTNRYPDPQAGPLREALADHLGASSSEIAIGPGSSGLLWYLASAYVAPGDEIVMHAPAFEAYPIIARMSQARPVPVPLTDWTTDPERLVAAVTPHTKVVFCTDPHNPTGTATEPGAVEWLAAELEGRCLLVVDQAYLEYADGDPTRLDRLHRTHPDTLLLRTFSKAHGLAALRVGYCLASPQVASTLQRVAPPFAVGELGIVAARASLEAPEELAAAVGFVRSERRRIEAHLREHGLDVPESQANFVFCPTGADSARLVGELERRGVVARTIGDDGLRVTVGLVEENDRFLEAWVDLH